MSSTAGQDGHLKRLIAIAGMLGSDHDGERANAARLATLELRRMGLTWAELIGRAFQAVTGPVKQEPLPGFQGGWEPQRPRRTYSRGAPTANKGGLNLWDFLRYASLHRAKLGSWDANFVDTLLAYGPRAKATEAQWAQIFRIAETLNLAA